MVPYPLKWYVLMLRSSISAPLFDSYFGVESSINICDISLNLLCDVTLSLLCDVTLSLLCDVTLSLLCDVTLSFLCDVTLSFLWCVTYNNTSHQQQVCQHPVECQPSQGMTWSVCAELIVCSSLRYRWPLPLPAICYSVERLTSVRSCALTCPMTFWHMWKIPVWNNRLTNIQNL